MRFLFLAALAAISACSTSAAPPAKSAPTASEGVLDVGPIPAGSIEGEKVVAGSIDIRGLRKIEDHERGKVACTFDQARGVHLCAADLLDAAWTKQGTRVFVIGRDFDLREAQVTTDLFSSYLWGDFDADGHPDFLGFRDAEERWKPEEQPPVVLYLGTEDPTVFRPGAAFPFANPAKAGAVVDFDADGCADVLVLGTGVEKTLEDGTFDAVYYDDAIFRGDCGGRFVQANDATGLSKISGFEGYPQKKDVPKLGRTAVVTDLDDDLCPDLLVGNYRAFPSDALHSNCAGGYIADRKHPAVGQKQPSDLYGHTVGLFPYDLKGRGALDLAVANVYHGTEPLTDPSHVLLHDEGGFTRVPSPYDVEAPFGSWVGDLDQDGRADFLVTTGDRWNRYEGRGALAHLEGPIWRDEKDLFKLRNGWLKMRETPVGIDANFDGYVDWIGDGRFFANHSGEGVSPGRFIGFSLRTPIEDPANRVVLSGIIARVSLSDGSMRAVSLASDGRGQPASIFSVPIGDAAPTRLDLALAPDGRTISFDLSGFEPLRYHVVTVRRGATPAPIAPVSR